MSSGCSEFETGGEIGEARKGVVGGWGEAKEVAEGDSCRDSPFCFRAFGSSKEAVEYPFRLDPRGARLPCGASAGTNPFAWGMLFAMADDAMTRKNVQRK